VVLVLPQIGDTLDADNQVPGGMFAELTLDQDGELAIVKHFVDYERTRTWVEGASLTSTSNADPPMQARVGHRGVVVELRAY